MANQSINQLKKKQFWNLKNYFRAPVTRSLHQVSSDLDQTHAKAEANWKIIILPQAHRLLYMMGQVA